MPRSKWTDERLDDAFSHLAQSIDQLRVEMRSELSGLRGDVGALRADVVDLRNDFSGFKTALIQVGFGLVGVLLAALVALIVAVA